MNRLPIPGCWYLDSLPTGEYAAILPFQKQVQTHQGLVPYPSDPPDEPLWLVVSNRPVFRFMGQGHDTGWTWEWSATVRQWNMHEKCCGVWALIYGAHGERLIAQCAPPTGSQGYRYIAPDGRPVPGDETIAIRHGLNEWTDLSLAQDGSILVGQDHEGRGAAVWADGHLRLLHRAGATFNVRSKYDPAIDVVSVSFYTVESDGIQGWIYWLSLAELRALPPAPSVDAPPALPTPVPNPPVPLPPPANPVPPHHPNPPPVPPAAPPPEVHMTTQKVALRLGEFFGRIDPATRGAGPDPSWFRLIFDRRDPNDPQCVFLLSKPDAQLKAQHELTGALLGIDGTEHGGNICQQFYGKPNEDRGAYESLHGFKVDDVPAVVVSYHRPNGVRYLSACLTVVEL